MVAARRFGGVAVDADMNGNQESRIGQVDMVARVVQEKVRDW